MVDSNENTKAISMLRRTMRYRNYGSVGRSREKKEEIVVCYWRSCDDKRGISTKKAASSSLMTRRKRISKRAVGMFLIGLGEMGFLQTDSKRSHHDATAAGGSKSRKRCDA